jgi:hypothetical protein
MAAGIFFLLETLEKESVAKLRCHSGVIQREAFSREPGEQLRVVFCSQSGESSKVRKVHVLWGQIQKIWGHPVIPDIQKLGTGQKNGLGKNWGIGDGSKNMFWDSSNLPWGQAQKRGHGDRSNGPIFDASRSENLKKWGQILGQMGRSKILFGDRSAGALTADWDNQKKKRRVLPLCQALAIAKRSFWRTTI